MLHIEQKPDKLKTAVTGKVKPGSKTAKDVNHIARSLGQLKSSAKTRNNPNSRIRQIEEDKMLIRCVLYITLFFSLNVTAQDSVFVDCAGNVAPEDWLGMVFVIIMLILGMGIYRFWFNQNLILTMEIIHYQ